MELSKTYSPAEIEEKWYRTWMEKDLFHSKPDEREPYSIVIPPPNVTGVLHMGHMLNNTLQDVLIRRARMLGYNACWVPGTDHASIATEAKVVQMLRTKNIRKSDLSRDEFLSYAWEWKEKHGGIILEQLKKLGCSCDWERTSFTMDPEYYKAVIKVFGDLYRKKFIYRGLRMINWDCEAKTALSNEEVIYKEEGEKAALYHVKYKIEGSDDEWVTVATIRPETIPGDTAIAVNPDDERYRHLIGKNALVPFVNRPIPIIADTYVDVAFGTGCLKITPAHDPNDNELGLKHNLPVIDILNDDGTLNENCEIPGYVGKDRFAVRKLIVQDLQNAGFLVKEEPVVTRIGRSERTNTVVEPKLSLQWFLRMKEISHRALQAVEQDEIRLHPAKFKNTYRHWMENVRDWCISRQLWWGHRIPAYYYGEGEDEFVVAESEEEALKQAREKSGNADLQLAQLKQDPDVLDTWASSWLWPIAVFDGFNDKCFDKDEGKIDLSANKELAYYYPTKALVTAPEILFFWVARMIIAGYEYLDKKPFEHVYLHGIVRDKQRRKMSKSLGNSPEPIELIKQNGADGVRVGMLFSAPAGNDILFDEKLCEQGRNFSNKIWNALRLITGWEVDEQLSFENEIAVDWFRAKFSQTLDEINTSMDAYRISEALLSSYNLIWDDFCSWYLELIKPAEGAAIDGQTYHQTKTFFNDLMKVLHPFMPFITEEVFQQLKEGHGEEFIMISIYPEVAAADKTKLEQGEMLLEIISKIRDVRARQGLKNRELLDVFVRSENFGRYDVLKPVLEKRAFLKTFESTSTEINDAVSFIASGESFFVVTGKTVNTEEEKQKLLDELKYTQGFVKSVEAKLRNEKFVSGAPADVVERERKKLQDGEQKLQMLEENLARLN